MQFPPGRTFQTIYTKRSRGGAERELHIILSDASYSKAMQMAGHLKNVERGCVLNTWTGFKTISLSLLLPKAEEVGHGYQLRVKKPTRILYGDRKVCRTERSSQFLTFKF